MYKEIMCYLYYLYFQAVTNEDVTQEELGGAKTHTSVSGEIIEYCTFFILVLLEFNTFLEQLFSLAHSKLYVLLPEWK